jgi:Anti-sigma-K factor rskA
MSSHIDPHDPRYEFDRLDNISLMALGEPADPAFHDHCATCEQCLQELVALSHTVGLAREVEEHRDITPPASVWTAITTELGITEPIAPAAAKPAGPHRMRWRLGLVAAAVAVLAAGVGFAVGRATDSTSPSAAGRARLTAQPGGPADVAGVAQVHVTNAGHQLTVRSTGLPLRPGYYEVWLYNARTGGMQPVGALGDDGKGTFTLAGNIDLHSYDIVDVSAQDYGGSTVVHQQSVLQGLLTQ